MFLITVEKTTGTPTSAVSGVGARATRSGILNPIFAQALQLFSLFASTIVPRTVDEVWSAQARA